MTKVLLGLFSNDESAHMTLLQQHIKRSRAYDAPQACCKLRWGFTKLWSLEVEELWFALAVKSFAHMRYVYEDAGASSARMGLVRITLPEPMTCVRICCQSCLLAWFRAVSRAAHINHLNKFACDDSAHIGFLQLQMVEVVRR